MTIVSALPAAGGPSAVLHPDQVVAAVAAFLRIPVSDLLGGERSEPLRSYRRIAGVACKRLTQFSWDDIGDSLNRCGDEVARKRTLNRVEEHLLQQFLIDLVPTRGSPR